MIYAKHQSSVKSIGEIINNSSLGAAIRAYEKYGYHSIEFKQAESAYARRCKLANDRGGRHV